MEKIGVPLDTKAYTMLIKALCGQGNIKEAIDVKTQMLVSHIAEKAKN